MTKKQKLTFLQKLLLVKKAGIANSPTVKKSRESEDADIYEEDIHERVRKLLGIFNQANKKTGQMIYFVMYDIENNKVRTYISKYLIKKGCTRIQKSIFLADSSRPEFNEIHETLREVQEVYDNYDSIMLVPVATDQLRAMKIIGKNIDMDLFLGNKNTLFY
jgi:CRISPR-associated protein Cas2